MTLVGTKQTLRTKTSILRVVVVVVDTTSYRIKVAGPARLWYGDASPVRRAGVGSFSKVLGCSEVGVLLARVPIADGLSINSKACVVRTQNQSVRITNIGSIGPTLEYRGDPTSYCTLTQTSYF